jgi:hypothetical protein
MQELLAAMLMVALLARVLLELAAATALVAAALWLVRRW